MGKTPYEVRLDVLKMAQEMLENDRQAKLATVHSAVAVSGNAVSYEDATKPVTHVDVINLANSLYGFVSDNSATGTTSLVASGSISHDASKQVLLERRTLRGTKIGK